MTVFREKKEENIEKLIFTQKLKGVSDQELSKKYGISYKKIEKILRKEKGLNLNLLDKKKKIKTYFPKEFKEEETTVWSFKNRGQWATHSPEYRGNWSPYIPRNVILKYTNPEDLVLDCFCGSGTTAIEAKLLGRKCIAIDINDNAVELAKKNVNFSFESLSFRIYEPEIKTGDARNLDFIKDNSIDLICTHPPYADAIQYSDFKEGDLSLLKVEDFLKEMTKVAKENYRVLKPGKKCAILIGDLRKNKRIVPLGFMVLQIYLDVGFKLKEIVIKRQHNCKTTGFWYTKSLENNFFLLAHEYLFIFEKILDEKENNKNNEIINFIPKIDELIIQNIDNFNFKKFENKGVETTTVWLFKDNEFKDKIIFNLLKRYSSKRLLYLNSNFENDFLDIKLYLSELNRKIKININNFDIFAIKVKDVRRGYLIPMGLEVINNLKIDSLKLKEIIILVHEDQKNVSNFDKENLKIIHEYLLIFENEK